MNADPAHGTLGPHTLTPFPIDVAIQGILEIAKKTKIVFFYGWVEYFDIFHVSLGTTMRRTEFCVRIEVVGHPLILVERGNPPPISVKVHGPYNGTDSECLYKPGERPPVGGLPPPTQPTPTATGELATEV